MHAVIFDIDGTLVHSAEVDDQLYRQSVSYILGPVRFRPSLTDYEYVSDSGILSQILEDNDISIDSDPTDSIKKHFVQALEGHILKNGPFIEIPGARNLLKSLRSSNDHTVAIATGGWRVTAELKLRSAGFDTSCIPIATSDAEYDRTRIMLTALSHLGTSFDSVTYYGDGPWDRDACNALGWGFIPVGPKLGGLESFSVASVT
ncbi:MAG: HAD family hydrolase [Gammaproteobacteria bacterium]|nr:HAD family hydrolase [Gammaproteobacteria bacterium]